MNIYNSLEAVIEFFVQPFLTVLEKLGIDDMNIKMAFGSVEWFSISLYNLIALVGSYIILYLFFKIIFKILKLFIKIITGGIRV